MRRDRFDVGLSQPYELRHGDDCGGGFAREFHVLARSLHLFCIKGKCQMSFMCFPQFRMCARVLRPGSPPQFCMNPLRPWAPPVACSPTSLPCSSPAAPSSPHHCPAPLHQRLGRSGAPRHGQAAEGRPHRRPSAQRHAMWVAQMPAAPTWLDYMATWGQQTTPGREQRRCSTTRVSCRGCAPIDGTRTTPNRCTGRRPIWPGAPSCLLSGCSSTPN